MEQFFTKDYHGAPYVLHLAFLAGVLLFNLSFILYLPFAMRDLRKPGLAATG